MGSKGVSYKHRKQERVKYRGHAQRLGVRYMAPVSQGLCTSMHLVSFFRLTAFIIQTHSFFIIYNLSFWALLQDILTNYLSSQAILEVRAGGVGRYTGWEGEKWAKGQSQGNRQGGMLRGSFLNHRWHWPTPLEPCQEHTHTQSQSGIQNTEVRTLVCHLGKSCHSQEICLAGDKEQIQSC